MSNLSLAISIIATVVAFALGVRWERDRQQKAAEVLRGLHGDLDRREKRVRQQERNVDLSLAVLDGQPKEGAGMPLEVGFIRMASGLWGKN
jgi:hypothetical protein